MLKLSIYFLLLTPLIFSSCGERDMDEYQSLVKKEKKKNKKVNDIFFGFEFGMDAKDFYNRCWEYNKKGMFTDGKNNTSVSYKLVKQELKHPADMNFYPTFTNGKIVTMEVLFQYEGWGPWTKELNSDKLLPDVLKLYKTWYPDGNPFIEITDEKKGTLYVKVDGNRRIILGIFDDTQVKADYSDLSVNKAS